MMHSPPNARLQTEEGEVKYGHSHGDRLKLRWKARRGGEKVTWIEFNPADLHVELNGAVLTTCQAVTITVNRNEFPLATLTFTLEELDIDADTMTALQAVVDDQRAKEEGHAEDTTSEA